MTALERRLLRLEAVQGGRSLRHLFDAELDTRLRTELAAWLREEPGACPATLQDELAPFLTGADAVP